MERLYDLEMDNSDLISETWGISIEETEKILTNSYYEEFNQEEALRNFACTGRLPIENESIYCWMLLEICYMIAMFAILLYDCYMFAIKL